MTVYIAYERERVVRIEWVDEADLWMLERVRILSEGEWLDGYRWLDS